MISVSKKDGTMAIKFSGKLDVNSAPIFDSAVNDNLDESIKNADVDLSDCPYISSAGIRCIVALQKKMYKRGGDVRLTAVSQPVSEILYETGLLEMIKVVQ